MRLTRLPRSPSSIGATTSRCREHRLAGELSVYPRSADLPILRRCEIQAGDQDAAVIEAMDRVDG